MSPRLLRIFVPKLLVCHSKVISTFVRTEKYMCVCLQQNVGRDVLKYISVCQLMCIITWVVSEETYIADTKWHSTLLFGPPKDISNMIKNAIDGACQTESSSWLASVGIACNMGSEFLYCSLWCIALSPVSGYTTLSVRLRFIWDSLCLCISNLKKNVR